MSVLTDYPVDLRESDLFDWRKKAQVLADNIIGYDVSRTGLTIGVQGDWGSGKTSFINLILQELGDDKTAVMQSQFKPTGKAKSWKTTFSLAKKVTLRVHSEDNCATLGLYFDSWLMSNLPLGGMNLVLYLIAILEDLLAAEAGQAVETANSTLQAFVDYSEKASKLIDLGGEMLSAVGIPFASQASWLMNKGLEAASQRGEARLNSQAYVAAFRAIGTLRDDFLALVERVRQLSLFAAYDDVRLVVVIDDLDRLPPADALQVTEKLKLFLDVPHTIFIIGADLEVVARGLEQKFGVERHSEEKRQYMNKIVRLAYPVPRLTRKDAYRLLAQSDNMRESVGNAAFAGSFADELLFVLPNMGHNPRNLKKVLLSYGIFRRFFLMSAPEAEAASIEPVYFRLLAIAILYQHNLELAKAFHQFLAELADEDANNIVDMGLCEQFLMLRADLVFEKTAVRRFLGKLAGRGFLVKAWLNMFAFASAM